MVDPAVQHFVDGPRKRSVEDARAAALDPDPSGARSERDWERMHPEGQATFVGDTRLVLWNFAVGVAALKPGHEAAIAEFMRRNRLRLVYGGAMLAIEGHASATGAEAMNMRLSQQRAEVVALKFMMQGVPSSSVGAIAAGERQSTGRGDTGEALARDRRVNVTLILPATVQETPTLEGGFEDPTVEPPSPTHVDPFTVAINLRFTVKVGPFEFPSAWGTTMLEGEIYLMRIGPPKATTTMRFDVSNGQLKFAVESRLSKNIRIVVGERSAIGVKVFDDLFVDFEVAALNPRWPFTVAFSVPPYPEVFEVSGVRFRIAGGKLRVGFRPSPELVRRFASLGQRFVGSIAGWVAEVGAAEAAAASAAAMMPLAYIGFIVWGFYELNESHKRGTRLGIAANMRRGYAKAIAYAARGQRPPIDDIESGPGFEEDRMARRVGAEIALQGWNQLDEMQQATIRQRLEGQSVKVTTDMVMVAIGGVWGEQQIPHPRELVNRIPARQR
jgi:outer membrane protein OmpA-like peptidoglycan-associated protein